MNKQPDLTDPKDMAYYRSLRKQIALALLFTPTMCVLPVLAFVASGQPESRIDDIILSLWIIISIVLIVVIWRAARLIRHLTHHQTSDQDQ